MSRKPFIRCTGQCTDGSRCGKAALRNSSPALCLFHSGQEHPSPAIPPSDEVDAIKGLKTLARSRNEQVRLRALDLIISLQQKNKEECPRCAAEQERDRERADVADRLSPAQRDRLMELITEYRAIKDAAKRQPIYEEPDVPTPVAPPVVAPPPVAAPSSVEDDGRDTDADEYEL